MKQVLVRYKVKEDRVAENEALIREVYKELHELKPAGFRYSTFKLDDGVSFVHVAFDENDINPLPQLGAFRKFQSAIKERCAENPFVHAITVTGSYEPVSDSKL